ncbi:non-heme iron oxygenase ferredoxin subunit [Roseococcus sp. SYP-B2431]|uniref:non-heme iron oxygenase ferredoxin subunit n=1 Tax=Roseococcus sp. SYP-B2431 TaxID=2496640 RepID=UPI00103D1A6B|nr:non-heme iron oxygenase ferredoxin subunit [Roseococcus sp. SYP-B2431]TCH98345.1 non-heme iron oxygenase ferredoxin subunit [Roseococcus sp. SYP-B2431]
MTWHDVAPEGDFEPDVPKVVQVGDDRIAVFRLDDGFYAISDICTHEYALLSDGFCEEGKIECPLHQACFDIRSGKALDEPAEIDLHTYPTRVEGGVVQFQL